MLMPGARDTNSICSLQGVFREKRAQHASQRLQNASKGELEDVCGYTSGSTSDEEVSEGAQERRDSEVYVTLVNFRQYFLSSHANYTLTTL